jgi:hypothetical protein
LEMRLSEPLVCAILARSTTTYRGENVTKVCIEARHKGRQQGSAI